jgi:TolB-like protein
MESNPDGAAGAATSQVPEPEQKSKKKKDKVRSAWISFVGRIIAQVLGAVATITLGLAVADHLRREPAAVAAAATTAPIQHVATGLSIAPDARVSVAVLPLALYSPDSGRQYMADALTDEIIAELASMPPLRVISRTSALQYRQTPKPIPEIAATLGVSVVIEGCVIDEGSRIRIRVRALDGTRDMTLGTVTRTTPIPHVRALPAELAASMARELSGIVLAASPLALE